MALPPTPRAHAGRAGAYLLGVLTTALVGGPVGYHYATKANTTLVVQQQHITEVQGFETTGGAVDNAMREFSDALVDRAKVAQSRNALRAAIGAHTSVAFAMRQTIGADYGPYMSKARQLRTLADAETSQEGVRVWQIAVDLIAMRKRIADRIKREVEGA